MGVKIRIVSAVSVAWIRIAVVGVYKDGSVSELKDVSVE